MRRAYSAVSKDEEMQKKHMVILLTVGLPLLGMMGCTGALVAAGFVSAASRANGQGQEERTMPSFQETNGPTRVGDGESVAPDSGEEAPQHPAPTPFGGMSGGMAMPDSPNYVRPYDPMASTPGTRGFDQLINDQSDIRSNETREVSRDVDNSVANPAIESGSYSSVSADAPAPAADSISSGSE